MRGGERPVIPLVNWKGVALSSAEVIKDTEDFLQFEGLKGLFSAVERFPLFERFYFGLIDFSI